MSKRKEYTAEDIYRSGVIAAATSMPLCAPAIRGMHLVMSDIVPTIAVDKWFRCYTSPTFIHKLVAEAEAITDANPCKSCGATEHHRIAYVGGAICHEAWHLLRTHFERAKQNNVATEHQSYVWNVAADAEINDGLLQVFSLANVPNKLCLPEWIILPKTIEQEEGKLSEEYYHILMEEIKKKQQCKTCNGTGNKSGKKSKGKGKGKKGEKGEKGDGEAGGKGDKGEKGEGEGDCPDCGGTGKTEHPYGPSNCGSGADGIERGYEAGEPGPDEKQTGLSEIEAKMVRKEVAKSIQKAAKQRGSLPGGWEIWADEELGAPKYNWRAELRKVLSRSLHTIPGDRYRSYRRLSRRCASLGYKAILPSSHDTTPKVTIVQDTSGSMSTEAIQTSLEETKGILKSTAADVTYINCDMNADKTQTIYSVKDIDLYGGGGTDMRVGIKAALESKPRPDVIILFTDGYTPWPANPPAMGVQLVVCLVGPHACEVNEVPQFARVVKIVDEVVDKRDKGM